MIIQPSISNNYLAVKTVREVEKISEYELKWKISTNLEKFQMLSISAYKPADIYINNAKMQFSKTIKVLGFNLGTSGFCAHIRDRLAKAKSALGGIRRFRNLSTKIYLHLYKALVRPHLEYPAILLGISHKTNLHKIQAIQNRALRTALKERPPYFTTAKDLHEETNLEPLNTRLYSLGLKTWDLLSQIDEDLVSRSRELNTDTNTKDHNWWPRIAVFTEGPPPAPHFAS